MGGSRSPRVTRPVAATTRRGTGPTAGGRSRAIACATNSEHPEVAIKHYDVISRGYEYFTERLFGEHRLQAVEQLRLADGQSVLDVAGGTGANLPLLQRRIGPTGHIVETDYSAGMLARASAKVARAGWSNVTVVEADARILDAEKVGTPTVDAAICVLGMTVIPDWEQAFDRMWDLLRPGGRIALMDLYLDGKRTSGVANTYYRVIVQAHSRRRFWEPLADRVDDFTQIDHQWFGGVARVVSGTKPLR